MSQSINQSIKTHFYSAICRERIRGGSQSVSDAAESMFSAVDEMQSELGSIHCEPQCLSAVLQSPTAPYMMNVYSLIAARYLAHFGIC